MRTREEMREESRRFDGDLAYEVWRSGGNPDRINEDRVSMNSDQGFSAEECAGIELRHQRDARRAREREEYPEDNMAEE